jgi:rhodanese-related sulfurtransferase/rubrerythrin
MQLATNPTTVTNITSQELREYIEATNESGFVLIDVRQSEEYMAGHIPGARLIPLNELEAHADELKLLANRRLIFYCRSGGRSARASAWASQGLRLPNVANLMGGFLGWDGQALVDFPRLTPFDLNGSADALLGRALDLEKGTHQLYEQIASTHQLGILADTFSALLSAELAHGKAVHQILTQISPGGQKSFEVAFSEAPGSIIENGMSLDAVLTHAQELGAHGEMALLELALEIELGAYDLYKNLAATVASVEARSALTELAQQEKGHADWVLRAIGKMAEGTARVAS